MFFSCRLLPRLLNTDDNNTLRFLQNVFFAGLTVVVFFNSSLVQTKTHGETTQQKKFAS